MSLLFHMITTQRVCPVSNNSPSKTLTASHKLSIKLMICVSINDSCIKAANN